MISFWRIAVKATLYAADAAFREALVELILAGGSPAAFLLIKTSLFTRHGGHGRHGDNRHGTIRDHGRNVLVSSELYVTVKASLRSEVFIGISRRIDDENHTGQDQCARHTQRQHECFPEKGAAPSPCEVFTACIFHIILLVCVMPFRFRIVTAPFTIGPNELHMYLLNSYKRQHFYGDMCKGDTECNLYGEIEPSHYFFLFTLSKVEVSPLTITSFCLFHART